MFEFAAAAFLSFLVIVDPVGLVPFFLSVTSDRSIADQRRIARNAVLIAGILIIMFGLGGGPLLDYLGVSIDALRIAGGVLLFKLAFDMILAHRERTTEAERNEAEERDDVTVFPLAIPLLAGPGAFATVLVLVARADGRLEYLGVLFASVVLVLLVAWGALRLAAGVTRVLGRTGITSSPVSLASSLRRLRYSWLPMERLACGAVSGTSQATLEVGWIESPYGASSPSSGSRWSPSWVVADSL